MASVWSERFNEEWKAAGGDELFDKKNNSRIGVRIYNALYRYAEDSVAGKQFKRPAYTLKDFATWSDRDLLILENFGKVSLAALRPVLARAKALNGHAASTPASIPSFEERLLAALDRIEQVLMRLAEK